MAFTIERIKSFLAKRRLPQFGHEANKDTYSVSLVLFQLCEHDKHFIFHPLFEPEAFHLFFLFQIAIFDSMVVWNNQTKYAQR